MPEADYIPMIRKLDRDGLLSLWEQIRQGDTPGWPDGKAFEYLVCKRPPEPFLTQPVSWRAC